MVVSVAAAMLANVAVDVHADGKADTADQANIATMSSAATGDTWVVQWPEGESVFLSDYRGPLGGIEVSANSS